ncbi:glutamate--tRNA ligase 1 [Alphaproteobacteria bacterium]|nr:glutamate--tRNA ligase 1 [Alphaproteobacteria bacterium]
MTVKVRFAPSPTGKLHVGNIRIGLINWLFARQANGVFVLRIDDTDRQRSTKAFEQGIYRDLEWLGLLWDEAAHQSERIAFYDRAALRLKAAGRLYPAYETSEELTYKRKRQLARGRPPVYDRAALALSDADKAELERQGRRPHWRFLLHPGEVSWDDLVRGPCHYEADALSDPVLIREDGSYLYTLPSVADDVDMAVTHVIRGEDHAANTAAQIQIFQALGGPVPRFAHLPLLTDAAGQGLSKRTGSASIEDLRIKGLEAMAVSSLLAHLGSSDPVVLAQTLDELAQSFDIARFGRATPKFDDAQLFHINAQIVRSMPYEQAKDRLSALGVEADEALWSAVRGNLAFLGEVGDWRAVCCAEATPIIEDSAYLAEAAALLPPAPWGGDVWNDWINDVKRKSGRKGRALFHPLRLALTGRGDGPEMKALLPLIGYDRAYSRLMGRKA